MISCAVMKMRTAALNRSTSKSPSAVLNFIKFSEARLQAVLSRKRYSLHGFVEFCRSVPLHVCYLGIVADPCAFGDFAQQRARVFLLASLAVGYAARPPFAPLLCCFHEFVAHANAHVFVLIHYRSVRVAVVAAVIALFDERPRFFLFLLLRVDELFDVWVPIFERVHLSRTACFAAALHDVRDLVVNFQKRKRPARFAAAA